MEALGMIVLIVIIYFVIVAVDKYNKETISVFIGTGVGCGAVLLQFAYGIIIILIAVVESCQG